MTVDLLVGFIIGCTLTWIVGLLRDIDPTHGSSGYGPPDLVEMCANLRPNEHIHLQVCATRETRDDDDEDRPEPAVPPYAGSYRNN